MNARKDLHTNSKKMHFACARELVEQIIPLYERACVPLRNKDNCTRDIIKLNDEMYNLMKYPKKQCKSKTSTSFTETPKWSFQAIFYNLLKKL